jgi:conjugal transfer pilus assembly protein TraB
VTGPGKPKDRAPEGGRGRPEPGSYETSSKESGSYRAHLEAEARADAAQRDDIRQAAHGPALATWKMRWASLSSQQQLRLKQAGVASVVGLLGLGLYLANGEKAEEVAAPPASKLEMGAGLRGDSLEVKLRGDLQKILDGQQLLGDRVTAIEEGKVVPGTGSPAGSSAAGELPPALPGTVPAFPEPPANGDLPQSEPAPPAIPSAPPAPPAPPVEKTVGAIGTATTPGVANNSGSGAKKRIGRSICRLVS